MTDHTVVESISPIKLIARLEQSDDPNAREAARRWLEAIKRPDRTVGAALMPKKRGGVSEWQAEQLAERNAAYRDLAIAECGTEFLTPKQAEMVCAKVERFLADAHLLERGDSPQDDALRRIRAAGLDAVGGRQLRNILKPPKKN